MGTGYTRQSAASIITGATITAAAINDEFNLLESAFNGTTGHSHDGSSGEGPLINLSTSVTGTLGVTQGGSGATSLTDGGLLLGSGTGAITAMAVLADGEIVVGDGTTDPVALAAFTSSTGTLKHEQGGLEADVSAFSGLIIISGGSTSSVAAPSGAVVGTTDAQVLTNKTISAASNTITIASTDLSDTSSLTYNTDTNVSGNSWVLDEDDMSSNSNTKVPTQQSVKSYVDSSGSGDMLAATYDAASIEEQVVGLTAVQTMTNKTLTQPTITLRQSTNPTPTAEGEIWWDTNNNQIKVGDGSSTLTFSDDSAAVYQTQGDVLDDLNTLGANSGSGEALIGTSAGTLAWQSAATLRDTIGVGTSDNPQLNGVNFGHASDTTVTRASAGNIQVEGNIIYRAGGTDVPVADGGTGSSTASGARTNLEVEYDVDVVAVDGSLVSFGDVNFVAGDIMYADGTNSVTRLAKGTAGQALVMNSGATAPEWGSSGSWNLLYDGQSVNNVDNYTFSGFASGISEIEMYCTRIDIDGPGGSFDVRLGDAGGIETTGYISRDDVSEFKLAVAANDDVSACMIRLTRFDGNRWWCEYARHSDTQASDSGPMGGYKELSAELTQVRIAFGDDADNQIWYVRER